MPNKTNVELVQKVIQYTFNDVDLLKQALTHRSANHKHNERLEFLGDAILGSVIATALYQKFPKANEGQLSRLRSFLVKEKALADLANELEFSQFVILGSGELKSGGFRRASILSDVFEAIIGAVILDSNYQKAEEYILTLYKSKLSSITLNMADKDPKTKLQEWLQARNYAIPNYEVVKEAGKDHAKTYWVNCKLDYQNISVEGSGNSRRNAEQDAACQTMKKLKVN